MNNINPIHRDPGRNRGVGDCDGGADVHPKRTYPKARSKIRTRVLTARSANTATAFTRNRTLKKEPNGWNNSTFAGWNSRAGRYAQRWQRKQALFVNDPRSVVNTQTFWSRK